MTTETKVIKNLVLTDLLVNVREDDRPNNLKVSLSGSGKVWGNDFHMYFSFSKPVKSKKLKLVVTNAKVFEGLDKPARNLLAYQIKQEIVACVNERINTVLSTLVTPPPEEKISSNEQA